ncbi:MAG TPA: transporter associated domain-containing protein [Casimicrobium huifangae]|jgi:magnesium and cobalt transporter|uniref:HlyC/CorC family transporter n=1 Tax=Casimicrobium huifangae TaxID=2591109 RepID=UPI0012EBBC15|nr:transporter associated domain-containing protein [Casimicrobium huifangae]HOB01503.1 transporter associated domain-containing protein [Casimicrobium huifangae]HQA32953.1 transporter associated domain-containing protein [Casimicrobium huifangae]HQD64331.1 transporter associated domain-containing protein [Casimicrobium huifangae]
MSDSEPRPKPSFFERLSTMLSGAPEDREDLLDMLRDAHERKLLDADALSIFEGALEVAEMTVSDVMVPRSQMDVIEIDDAPAEVIAEMVETRHSRYPVIGENRDEVVGILLAKDLLAYLVNPDAFSLKAVARPPIFVPETKRLNVLLREFRSQRNHMAIVIDEHGSVAGLVTLEDVLEQIVGEIIDEYDYDEEADNIVAETATKWRVKASTEIDAFNEKFGTTFSDDESGTVGGLLMQEFARVPHRGESITLGGFRFTVLRADGRRVWLMTVERV